MDTLLDARELHAWYGSSHVLHGVALHIARGQTVGLLGRNDWPLQRVLQTFPRLQERFDHLGAQLSGGEQQMLSIGRALMTHPALIVLDEATEGLAPQIVAEIWRVIGEIRRDGIATLIVDRDYRRVLANADQALVLQKGQVVLSGAADAVASSAALSTYLGL